MPNSDARRAAAAARPSLFAALAALAGGLACPAGEARSQPDAPLFSSHAPVELTLAVPLRTLVNRRSRRPEVDGTLRYTEDGATVELDLEVRTRGHSRLEICSFPPLRLNLKREQVPGTLFAGQNRLKLVTLCRDRSDYDQYLELEYLAYRIYNQVTDLGFRVRKADMQYVDLQRDNEVTRAPAFLLEDVDGVAQRVGMRAVELPAVNLADLAPYPLSVAMVFQYLIGNTDWSAIAAAEGEDCCHNMDVLAPRDGSTGLVVLPYDFDQTGLVNASYSEPNPALRIRTVRQRLYRGFCKSNEHLEQTIENFNGARADIEALLETASLEEEFREEALEYLAEGYAVLNDPERREAEITGRCRG